MLGSKAYTKALAPPDGSTFLLPNHKKFDTNFLPEMLIFEFLYRNTTLQMKINIFPFYNCSPNNLRISFGDPFYADPDRLSEKESGEGGKFLYHQA